MYSNNDFRSYSENHLEHKHKSPYAGGFTADGKNTSEYNHDYYIKNLWRWGVEKAGDAVDAAKKKINDAIDESDTQFDDQLREAYRYAKSGNKEGVKNSLKNAGGVAKNNLKNQAGVVRNTAQNYTGLAKTKIKNRIDASPNKVDDAILKGYRNTRDAAKSAGKSIRTGVSNGASMVRNTASTASNAAKKRVNQAIDNSRTQADDQLREAYRYARSGNKEAAVNSLKNAGGVTKNNLKNQAGVVKNTVDNYTGLAKTRLKGAIERSDNKVDDALLEGYRKTRDAVKNAPGAVAGAAKSAKDYVEDKSGLTARREAKAAWDKFSNTAKDETRASNAWDRAQAAARKNAKAGNDKNAEYYDRVADSKYATMKNLQRRRDTENAEYIRKSDVYDKTPLGRLESIADSIYSGAKDLKDNATRSAANALDRTVASVKDALGYDERDRRDTAARNASERPNSATSSAYSKAQSDYNKTPLGVAENAYKAARRAYDKAVDMYGEGSQGARKAAETLAGAAQEVYSAANRTGHKAEGLYERARYGTNEQTGRQNRPNVSGSSSDRDPGTMVPHQKDARDIRLRNQAARTNEERGIGIQSGRDNGALTPIQKNRQDKGIPQWLENYAESVGGNAKKASKQIQKYLQEVQKHGADSRQAQEARAEAMSAVTSALEPNRSVSDSGTRSSYNDTSKQKRAHNSDYYDQHKEQIAARRQLAVNTAKAKASATSSDDSNDKEFYDNWYYDPHLGVYRLDNSEHRAQVAEENAKKERMRNEFINDTQNVVDNLGRTNVERLLDAIADVGKATKKKKR